MPRRLPILALALLLPAPAAAAELTHVHGTTMGPIVWNVKVAALSEGTGTDRLRDRVAARLERVDALMSTWREDSEVSRFNRSGGTDWFAVSPETATVVRRALATSRSTGGAFDVTVAPLVNLWSFGEHAVPERVPSDAEIAAARAHVGSELVEVRDDPPAIRKSDPAVTLNLSAIAKGFAVDEVARELEDLGSVDYLVEIGGELRVRGERGDGEAWRVGVERPSEGWPRTVLHGYVVGDRSLATSGDYRSYFEAEGVRYSHTIDPTTGRPIVHRLASVSVVAEDCTAADAWATALMVLGPEEGYNLAVERDLAALFLVRAAGGAGFVERATPAFERVAVPVAPPSDPAAESSAVTTYVIAFVVFLAVIAAMSVGVIVGNRRIRGSCGGLANMHDRDGRSICDGCTNPLPDCGGLEEGRARDEAFGRGSRIGD
jgi:FAD:protein FMN transferase